MDKFEKLREYSFSVFSRKVIENSKYISKLSTLERISINNYRFFVKNFDKDRESTKKQYFVRVG